MKLSIRSSQGKKAQRTSAVGGDEMSALVGAAATEPQLWANLKTVAEQSLVFWESMLDLRKSGAAALTSADRDNLLKIVRAVCWVESKHGTSGSNQPKRDPMQIGNPGDPGWKQFAGVITQKDRYVRGPNYPGSNYWADELPAAAAAESSFPAAARVASLADVKEGHRDSKFNSTMSFYWSVPHLVFKTNAQAAGRPAYLFDTLSRDELLKGAVAYNGGGDPGYEKEIDQALSDQGWPSTTEAGLGEAVHLSMGSVALAGRDHYRAQGLQLLRDVYDDVSRAHLAGRHDVLSTDGKGPFRLKLDLTGIGSLEVEVGLEPARADTSQRGASSFVSDKSLFAGRLSIAALSVDDLDLSGDAKLGAESLKKQFGQLIVFTSGRRSVASQAKAMAENIVNVAKDRKWIEKTYAASAERTELQDWIDQNPQATTVAQIQAGLSAIMEAWSDSERAKISRHIAGLAFDLVPVRGAKEQEVVKAIKALASFRKLLDGEAGVDVWHVEFT